MSKRLFIESVLLAETKKLVSLRCFDLGFVPFDYPNGIVKMWGPTFTRRNQDAVEMQHVSLETRLEDLKLTDKFAI